jgi:hypothetical protein
MGFQRTVPSSRDELNTYLQKIHENRSRVKSVKMNEANGHLEIDLDGMANFAGYPDVYMPIKKGRAREAKDFVERMMRNSQSGYAPSEQDANTLFDMIDHQAR